jgi:hypothetical protein
MIKNYGSLVSGYLDPELRAWETTVFQSGKPVLDRELNLNADLDTGAAQGVLRRSIPSGWLEDGVLERASSVAALFTATGISNALALPALTAHVNGWVVSVRNTGVATTNRVDLGAAPTGAGAKRTDVVLLEVWRRLISPSDATGKSPTGRIWRDGNVKIASADDATLNFADDVLDGTVGATTRRVQVQYRLRVVQGVDVFAYPSALDDPTVVARSVPASAGAPDGVSTAFPFVNQSAAGDPGLWRAGDGNPANTLGTVDGYLYAVPLCAVFRRNSTAFNRNTNHNGAGPSSGASGRPDGLFHDIFVLRDVGDLRRAVSPRGWNYEEVAEKNLHALLDNQLRSEWGVTAIGGGCQGHSLFTADEVGVTNANGGDGSTNGDTPGANFIGQFDSVRRRFSDRPVYEVVTVALVPGGAGVSTATWQTGTTVTLQPSALTPYPYAALNFPAFAPNGTRVVDVVGARIQGPNVGQVTCDVGFQQASSGLPRVPLAKVTGVGAFPMGDIVITLGTIPAGLSALTTEPIYVDLLVAYPSGQGLTNTPTADFGASSFVLNNPGNLPASAPVRFSAVSNLEFDYPHREANFQYVTASGTYSIRAATGGANTIYKLPERANAVTVTKNAVAATSTLGSDGRTVTLVAATAPGDALVFTYQALRPIPQTGAQFTVYYEARAPQTIRTAQLGTSLALVPRYISPRLYAITAGSGSPGEGYPLPFAYVQTGGVSNPPTPFTGEHRLSGSEAIYVGDFNASTGLLQVPVYVPYAPDPSAVQFTRSGGDVDAEGRSFFPTIPGGSYVPSAYGNPLSDARVHKTVLPCLMEAAIDSTLGPKGSLYLVLFVRWADFDPHVSVAFNPDTPSASTTTACVFRLNGNLANRRS